MTIDQHDETRHFMAEALRATIFGAPATAAADVAPYFDPERYVQTTDGTVSDFTQFIEHIVHLRGVVSDGRVEVHEALRDGDLVADRHTVSLTLTDGSEVTMEVLLIGELDACGRFVRVIETTRQLSGEARHGDLGRAR